MILCTTCIIFLGIKEAKCWSCQELSRNTSLILRFVSWIFTKSTLPHKGPSWSQVKPSFKIFFVLHKAAQKGEPFFFSKCKKGLFLQYLFLTTSTQSLFGWFTMSQTDLPIREVSVSLAFLRPKPPNFLVQWLCSKPQNGGLYLYALYKGNPEMSCQCSYKDTRSRDQVNCIQLIWQNKAKTEELATISLPALFNNRCF